MAPAVENIWHSLASELRAIIRSGVRNHETAEDILQDVLLKIHEKLPTLRGGDRLEAWVWRITRNTIADHFRRLRPSESLTEEVATAAESESELPDLNPCIRRFVGQLPPGYRDALVLTEWRGFTQEQMAKQLGLSVSGAKSRVQRARIQLKKLLLDCCRLELDRRGNVLEMRPQCQLSVGGAYLSFGLKLAACKRRRSERNGVSEAALPERRRQFQTEAVAAAISRMDIARDERAILRSGTGAVERGTAVGDDGFAKTGPRQRSKPSSRRRAGR